jgi:hypothetical protein
MLKNLAALSGILAIAGCATAGAGSPGGAAPAKRAGGATKPVFLAADMSGKSGDELDALLGAPDLMRIEGTGEFRRYALQRCSLIVILYPDEKGMKRAAHLDAASLKTGDEKPDLDACLAGGKGETP